MTIDLMRLYIVRNGYHIVALTDRQISTSQDFTDGRFFDAHLRHNHEAHSYSEKYDVPVFYCNGDENFIEDHFRRWLYTIICEFAVESIDVIVYNENDLIRNMISGSLKDVPIGLFASEDEKDLAAKGYRTYLRYKLELTTLMHIVGEGDKTPLEFMKERNRDDNTQVLAKSVRGTYENIMKYNIIVER